MRVKSIRRFGWGWEVRGYGPRFERRFSLGLEACAPSQKQRRNAGILHYAQNDDAVLLRPCRRKGDASEEGEIVGGASGRFAEDAGGEDCAAAVVMEGDGEGEDAPGEALLFGFGLVEEAPAGAVDVGLAAVADGLEDLAPVTHERVELLKDAAPGEPIAGLTKIFRGGVVAILPDALLVEDLDQYVGADGEGETGVEEVAGVDDDGSAAAFGAERAEGIEEVVDGAVALEQVHVFDAAEVAVEGGGEDDDGDVGAAAAKESCDLGAELAGSEMVVEDGYVDVVEELGGFFNGGGRDALVSVLAEDCGAEMEIVRFVVQQQNTYGLVARARHLVKDARDAVGRLNHRSTPFMMLLYIRL
jgi:hypothetical protein